MLVKSDLKGFGLSALQLPAQWEDHYDWLLALPIRAMTPQVTSNMIILLRSPKWCISGSAPQVIFPRRRGL